MTTDVLTKPIVPAVFPAAQIEATLRAFLLESVEADAAIRGTALPADLASKYSAAVQLDSLDVVNNLCEVEPFLGFELKDSIVKAGGYRSINEAVGHIMPKIEAAWSKYSNGKAK